MFVQELVKSITERLGATSHVNAVFGESREIGKKAVIPIAEVCLGFGAGGGEGRHDVHEDEPAQEGSGGGGGGCAWVRPIAVIEVTEEQTRFVPVLDYTRIILASIMCLGVSTCLITKAVERAKIRTEQKKEK